MKKMLVLLMAWNMAFAEEKHVIGTLPGEGLFASFQLVLNNLMWADKNNKVPVVYWSEKVCYAQKEGYNGGSNPWEYYFEPVSHLAYENGDKVNHNFDPEGTGLYASLYHREPECFNTALRLAAKAVIDKYIKVKPNILEKARAFYEQKMKGKTNIGVHLRGTDKVYGERKMQVSQHILEAAERAASAASGDVQFFIASDDDSLLDFAKATLHRPIVYCESHHRSEGYNPVHKSDGETKALVGEEVLIECLLLSECDFLVHSISSVALTALAFNPNLQYEYVKMPEIPRPERPNRHDKDSRSKRNQ